MPRKPVVTPELAQAIRDMQPRQELYELIKKEMQRRGRWKYRRRGIPFHPGHDGRREGKKLNQ